MEVQDNDISGSFIELIVMTAESTEWTEEIIYLRRTLKAMNTMRGYDMYVYVCYVYYCML